MQAKVVVAALRPLCAQSRRGQGLRGLVITAIALGLLALQVGCKAPEPVPVEDLCASVLGAELEMGVSDAEDVRAWMETRAGQDPGVEIVRQDDAAGQFVWRESGHLGSATVRDGRLFVGSVELDRGPQLGQVVKGSGPPESVDAGLIKSGPGCEEKCPYYIDLYYPSLGAMVNTWEWKWTGDVVRDGEYSVRLSAALPVKRLYCFSPTTMETALDEVFLLSPEGAEDLLENMIAWPGFGKRLRLQR